MQINVVLRESLLDHVYSWNHTLVNNLSCLKPIVGDHVLVHFDYTVGIPAVNTTIKKNLPLYNKEQLITNLCSIDWTIKSDDVQGCWNKIENKLIIVIDGKAPLEKFKNNSSIKTIKTPHDIKNLINRKRNLQANIKKSFNKSSKDKIKIIDLQIKRFYYARKSNEV